MDGDGIPDLISASYVYDSFPDFTYKFYLSVNLGNGDGTFQDGKAFAVSNGITAFDVGVLERRRTGGYCHR